MSKEEFKKIIEICCKDEKVRDAVIKNHDNNMWWPLDVYDYRKRLLIAGLSTRISYNMINSYIKVINNLNSYEYEEIKNMNENEIISIIKGLGLANTRYKYISSMIDFIEKYDTEIKTLSNNELIKLIANIVNGASYKVAQCAVLYVRGYYSGIMPVDSGMKDTLLPCLGFKQYNNALGHDILRKEIEELTKNNNMEDIIKNNGYEKLKINDYNNATWFCHLVLIYYKRYFCNKHNYEKCLLKDYLNLKYKCKKNKVIVTNNY